MQCEGTVHNPCPYNRKGSDVEFTIGDLWLCNDCSNARFGKSSRKQNPNIQPESNDMLNSTNYDDITHDEENDTNPKQIYTRSSTGNINEETNVSLAEYPESIQLTNLIIDPLLTYVVSSLNTCTPDNIKRAVLSHFTTEKIIDAKNKLWAKSDTTVIGEKARRKDSTIRSEKEAHLSDTISALIKLDKADKLPFIVIEAQNLHTIPRSQPEELNNISLADRLNKLESKFDNLQDVLDRTICENIMIKERLEKMPSYSSVVKSPPIVTHSINQSNPSVVPEVVKDLAEHGNANITKNLFHSSNVMNSKSDDQSRINPDNDNQTHKTNTNVRGRGGSRRGSMRSRAAFPGAQGLGRGTSHRKDFLPFGSLLSLGKGCSMISLDRESYTSAKSSKDLFNDKFIDNDGFRAPNHVIKKHKQNERQRHRIITGNAVARSGHFKGAPEPGRDLFIYRVDTSTDVSDLRTHLTDYGFHIRKLDCISNPDSKFKSFKLTVPMSEFNDLFDGSLWPFGVRVRKYIPPKREASY